MPAFPSEVWCCPQCLLEVDMSPPRGKKWVWEPCLLRAPLPCEVFPAVLGKQDSEGEDKAIISLWRKTPGKQVLNANSERALDFYLCLPPALQWIAEFNARERQVPGRWWENAGEGGTMALQIILTAWNTESKKEERNNSKLRQRRATLCK